MSDSTLVTSVDVFEQLVSARIHEERPDLHFFRVKKGFTPNAEAVAIVALSAGYREGNKVYDAVTTMVDYVGRVIETGTVQRLMNLGMLHCEKDLQPFGNRKRRRLMDPNEALKKMRALVKKVLHDEPSGPYPDIEEMFESFEALDERLSSGGFLPTDWER